MTGDLGGVRVGLVELDRHAMVGANWWVGGRGYGCLGWLLVGKDSDAVHGDLPEKPGPGGPQHQPGVSPSRDDDKAMSQQRRKGLDSVTPLMRATTRHADLA